MIDLPKVVFVADIAKRIGWSTERTRRWLKSLGALEKRGRKFVTTKTKLRSVFPEMCDEADDEPL